VGPAFPLAVLVGSLELVGGLLLILGARTLFTAGTLAMATLVSTWTLRLAHGFFLNWGVTPGQGHGFEYDLVLLAALVTLMLTGAGAFSVDGRRARDAEAQAFGRARLRAGNV
jgi:putative oxidoreductase